MGKTRTKAADKQESDILEREKKSLQLRKAGASYRAIGEQLGVSHIQARRDVEQALSYIRDDVAQDARKLRDLELARLDDMQLKLQSYINNPTATHILIMQSMDRLLKISERRARLLGLDMPVKYEEVTWQSEILTLLREGKITREQVEQELGTDLATEFFKSTGLSVITTGQG